MSERVEVQRYNRTARFDHDELFCPFCGQQTVWTEDDAGDFYYGPTILCVNCNNSMAITQWDFGKPTDENAQTVTQIKEATCYERSARP